MSTRIQPTCQNSDVVLNTWVKRPLIFLVVLVEEGVYKISEVIF